MSHTNHANLTMLVNTVRAVEADAGRPISILVDLQGPKLRLGKIDGGEKRLESGKTVTLCARGNGARSRPPSDAASGNLRGAQARLRSSHR